MHLPFITLTVNPQGQPITIKDPLNNTTTFTYELGACPTLKRAGAVRAD